MTTKHVLLESVELYPYYDIWSGYGTPDFDKRIPQELWERYYGSLLEFMKNLNELKEVLDDN